MIRRFASRENFKRITPAVLLYIAFLLVTPAVAQTQPSEGKRETPVGETPVAAYVGDVPIYAGEVEEQLAKVQARRPIAARLLPQAKAEILEELIDRRLVDAFLYRAGQVLTEQDLDRAVENYQRYLGGKPELLEQYLTNQGLTETQLRQRLAGQVGWPLYVRRMLTDEKLEAYFQEHAANYDGTRVRASQILLKLPQPATEDQIAAALQKAAAVRGELLAGEISFADAAKKYSEAPSRVEGGDLGVFPRHGQLPEPVAEAAFALQDGQLSQPVVSRFGVHLLQRTGSEPGTKTWKDVRPRLAADATQELFRATAEAEREQTPVRYTDALPHLDAEGRLVQP